MILSLTETNISRVCMVVSGGVGKDFRMPLMIFMQLWFSYYMSLMDYYCGKGILCVVCSYMKNIVF